VSPVGITAQEGKSFQAGLWMAGPICLKVFPAFLLVYPFWRRDFRSLLPLCALGGATLVVLADVVSRVLLPSTELPIGAFTAILGVPFFLAQLRKTA